MVEAAPVIGTLPQFLLVVAGISFFVVAFCHVPRLHQRQALEQRDADLRAEIEDIRAQTADIEKSRKAFINEEHIRDSVLRRLTDEHPPGAMTVTQWLSRGEGDRAGIQDPD